MRRISTPSRWRKTRCATLMCSRFEGWIGGPVAHVTVLYEGKLADMFVREDDGLWTDDGGEPPFEMKEVPTAIYHQTIRQRGDDPTDAPSVHGPVVLFVDRIV